MRCFRKIINKKVVDFNLKRGYNEVIQKCCVFKFPKLWNVIFFCCSEINRRNRESVGVLIN